MEWALPCPGWALARAVSRLDNSAWFSGTALAVVLARRLQLGDPGGELRLALSRFPFPEMADRVLADFFIPHGKPADAPFKLTPMPTLQPRPGLVELTVVANFVEVFLARQGHSGPVGINYLEKIQLPTLASLSGRCSRAWTMCSWGRGFPAPFPASWTRLPAANRLNCAWNVEGALPGEDHFTTFDPQAFCRAAPRRSSNVRSFSASCHRRRWPLPWRKRPAGGWTASSSRVPPLAATMRPPRGPLQLSAKPASRFYGERDVPELEKIRALNRPFWMAVLMAGLASWRRRNGWAPRASSGHRVCLREESGLDHADLKRQVLELSRQGRAKVFHRPAGFADGLSPEGGAGGRHAF